MDQECDQYQAVKRRAWDTEARCKRRDDGKCHQVQASDRHRFSHALARRSFTGARGLSHGFSVLCAHQDVTTVKEIVTEGRQSQSPWQRARVDARLRDS